MLFLAALLASIGIDIVGSIMDASISDKGIKAGIAVEGNSTLCFFARTDKPSTLWLHGYNFAFIALVVGLGAIFHNSVLAVLAPTTLFVDAIKHYQGYRQWKWMFNNPGKLMPQEDVWQKFFGFWG